MSDNFRIELDLGRVPRVLSALQRLQGLKLGLRVAAVYFKGKADDYPAQKSVSRKEAYGQAFFSDIQRKAFFAMLDSKEISVPYRRRGSGGLAGKWSVNEKSGGLTQEIGNNAGHARIVLDKKKQSRMMAKIGWKTVQDVFLAEKAAIQRIIREHIIRSSREIR